METYPCPWCKEDMEIDPALRARPFMCVKCGNESAYPTIISPNKHLDAVTLFKHASEAVAANVHKHTFAMVDMTDSKRPVSTGTLLNIGHRVFVITCRHSIPTKPNGKVAFVEKVNPNAGDPLYLSIISYMKDYDEGPDVGFLELEFNQGLTQLGAYPIGIDRVADLGTGKVDRGARVFGYPAEWHTTDPQLQLNLLTLLSLGSWVIDPEVWNTISLETRNPDPGKDIILHFDQTDQYLSWGAFSADQAPKPYGMSGGGCWQSTFPVDTNELWSPEDFYLFGIQASWPREGRYLKATQVIHWLRLIAVCYDDLRDELVDRFPRLKDFNLSEV